MRRVLLQSLAFLKKEIAEFESQKEQEGRTFEDYKREEMRKLRYMNASCHPVPHPLPLITIAIPQSHPTLCH